MASRPESTSSSSDAVAPDSKKMKNEPAVERPRWSSKDRIDLVNLWKNCPELYDYYNPEFNMVERRYEIYQMIGKRLAKKRSADDVRCTMEYLHESWKADRVVFGHCKKKQTRGAVKLSSSLYDALSFLENSFPRGERNESLCFKYVDMGDENEPMRDGFPVPPPPKKRGRGRPARRRSKLISGMQRTSNHSSTSRDQPSSSLETNPCYVRSRRNSSVHRIDSKA